MRTRSSSTRRLQSLRKRRPQSIENSSVSHTKMKAKEHRITAKHLQAKPRKNLVTSKVKVSQPVNHVNSKKQDIHVQHNLLADLQLEANNSITRFNERDDESESSGDEELPAIFDSSAPKTKVNELVPGTVVWAKSRGWPHWPAVLIKFFNNEKKAWVNYFDAAHQRIQVSIRTLVPFSGPNRSQFIEKGKCGSCSDGFCAGLERAEDYIIKRGLGKSLMSTCNMSSTSEFDTNMHSQPSSPRITSTCVTSLSHDNETSDQLTTCRDANVDLLSSDEELRIGYPIQSSCLTIEEKPKEDADFIKRQKAWNYTQNRLLKYIHRDTTKKHLLAIYKGQKKSERHQLFESARKSDREKLRSMASLGPITNDEQENDLTDFLRNLYVDHCMKSKEDLPNLSYITEVWLPEAVIFAIQKTRRVGKSNAEKLFLTEGAQCLVDLGEDVPCCMSSIINQSFDQL